MNERYIAFDVETPNHRNDRMSAIGVAVVENGVVTEEFSTLIDPETEFDWFNTQLTGITPEAVEGAPTFRALWPRLEEYFSSGLLIAHNAPFDMSVLAKCLRAYEIDWRRTAEYACTVRMGRACYPQLPDHKLDTMCAYFGIPLDHHRAGSDSRACAELMIRYLGRELPLSRFRRVYDLELCKTLGTGRVSQHSR